MSWEYFKYEATCESCGHRGFCIEGSDDWGRSSTSWEGFENRPPHATAVAKKRADSRDMVPVCHCTSTKILIGKLVQTF
jgi:hypothetical protein